MGKKLIQISAILVALGVFSPVANAAEGFVQYVSPAGDAADKDGDRNGIGLFNREEANKVLKKVEGKITAVSETELTVQTGKMVDDELTLVDYTFTIDANTKVIRRFRGTATWDELAVGHRVRVYATALEDGTAKLIWDKSIWWLRLGGKVTELNDTDHSFQLMTPRRNRSGNLKTFLVKIKTNENTVYMNSDETAATWDDLDNLDTVRIRGSWNNVSKYVLAKKITIVLSE